jgi:transcriptional regulator with XRE-family HTH domain
MPPPDDTPIELTEEEKLQLQKARRKLSDQARRDQMRSERGVLTYAQRQAKRRALREAAEKKRAEIDRERRAKVERRKRAFELWAGGLSKARVAVEIGVSEASVNNWLRGMTRPEPEPEPDLTQQALELETSQAVADERMMARDEEEQNLMELAEAHDKPADKYQAYVAASAIRLLRDSMKLIRGPRTVREFSELDQLIRRNLGLNPKGGAGGSTLNIDISILNNTKASHGAIGPIVNAETT